MWNPCYSNSLEDPLLTLPVVKVNKTPYLQLPLILIYLLFPIFPINFQFFQLFRTYFLFFSFFSIIFPFSMPIFFPMFIFVAMLAILLQRGRSPFKLLRFADIRTHRGPQKTSAYPHGGRQQRPPQR